LKRILLPVAIACAVGAGVATLGCMGPPAACRSVCEDPEAEACSACTERVERERAEERRRREEERRQQPPSLPPPGGGGGGVPGGY
jgi:hypothetical protein